MGAIASAGVAVKQIQKTIDCFINFALAIWFYSQKLSYFVNQLPSSVLVCLAEA